MKHQERMDVVAGLRELRRHAGLLHSDPMRKPGLCYQFLSEIVYTESSCAMLVSSLKNFGAENPSPVRQSDQNANRMQMTLSHAC